MGLVWRIVPPEEVVARERHRCPSRRGRRGKTQCEMDTRLHAAGFHSGRGVRGQWFFWPTDPPGQQAAA